MEMHGITAITGISLALHVFNVGAQNMSDRELLAAQTPAQKRMFQQGPDCNPAEFSHLNASYDFDGKLDDHFIHSPRWLSEEATLKQLPDQQAAITATGVHISEAWLAWHSPLSSKHSWMIEAHIKVPKAWDHDPVAEAQVGIGMFVGKAMAAEPASTEGYKRQSATVYEVNLATVAREIRFIQAQMINNRLGYDPDQTSAARTSLEELDLGILYCAPDQSLSVYYDAERLDTQAINQVGMVDWKLPKDAVFDVGIMGFAENSDLSHDAPTVSGFKILVSTESTEE